MNCVTNNHPPANGVPGGQGVTFSTSGSPVGYAGGGGGAGGAQEASGGQGGHNNPSVGNGAGGGGGAEYPGGPSPNTCGAAAGASGVVIINYPQ